MDDILSTEAIKANIEYYKRLKEQYQSLYSEALLNEIKYTRLLEPDEDDQ